MAEIEAPRSPPPPRRGPRDDSAGTLFKLAGSCCVTFCACIYGLVLFLISIPGIAYGSWILVLISAFCILLGCYSAKCTWNGIKKASE